jgi:hypothetical protein
VYRDGGASRSMFTFPFIPRQLGCGRSGIHPVAKCNAVEAQWEVCFAMIYEKLFCLFDILVNFSWLSGVVSIPFS